MRPDRDEPGRSGGEGPGEPPDAGKGEPETFHLIWLTGLSCDGCTIRALGDPTRGGLQGLLAGDAEGFPPLRVHHPVFSPESGRAFREPLERAARGELARFGVVNESSLAWPEEGDGTLFGSLGEDDDGRPLSFGRWLERLAPGADFVVAWGDCGVWGGPHSIGANPAGATGTSMFLGPEYRSRLDLPVVNLPGCAPPEVLTETLFRIFRWMRGEGAALELDPRDRPSFAYGRRWNGALATWEQ